MEIKIVVELIENVDNFLKENNKEVIGTKISLNAALKVGRKLYYHSLTDCIFGGDGRFIARLREVI